MKKIIITAGEASAFKSALIALIITATICGILGLGLGLGLKIPFAIASGILLVHIIEHRHDEKLPICSMIAVASFLSFLFGQLSMVAYMVTALA